MRTAFRAGRGYVDPYECSMVLENTMSGSPQKGLLSFIGRTTMRFLRRLGNSQWRER
jgi:hypothetical protein